MATVFTGEAKLFTYWTCRILQKDKGWALSCADQEEDMRLIKEMGANTIRLAHYQHDQYFYDLCDREGMAVWTEIPFISEFNPSKESYDNTITQMKELIAQNYNHPCVIVWGITTDKSEMSAHLASV